VPILNGYATLADIRGFGGVPAGDTGDDALLELAVEAASRQVDAYTGRTFYTDADVMRLTATDATRVDVRPGITTTTGLAVATDEDDDGTYETTWTIDVGYRLEPLNAPMTGDPWTSLVARPGYRFPTHAGAVRVTATFGTGSVPAPVKQATLILAAKLWKRKDAVFGVAGSPEYGSEVRILAGDRDAERLLEQYRYRWVVA
jgi:hypothetical protein